MAKCQASVNSNNWNFSLKARSINQACYRICFQSVIWLKIVTPVSASVILQLLSTSVLVCLGCCNKIPQIGCLKNINLFSHSSGDWEIQGQGIGRSTDPSCPWRLSYQSADCCLLFVSSHVTENETKRQSQLSGIFHKT